MTREQVASALLAKLQAALGTQVTTIGRKHAMPPDLTPDLQPALFVVGTANGRITRPTTPGKRTMLFHLFLYCHDDSPAEPIGEETDLLETVINNLLDAIDTALAPAEATMKQTLGGLVEHCWIEGDTPIDPGIFGKQGFTIVPVNVLLP